MIAFQTESGLAFTHSYTDNVNISELSSAKIKIMQCSDPTSPLADSDAKIIASCTIIRSYAYFFDVHTVICVDEVYGLGGHKLRDLLISGSKLPELFFHKTVVTMGGEEDKTYLTIAVNL